jgi:hypothetical protein
MPDRHRAARQCLDPSTPYRRVIVRFLLGDRPGVERELVAAQEVYRLRDDEMSAQASTPFAAG